jgi:phenylalanyl-tRNA synthetase beta chain
MPTLKFKIKRLINSIGLTNFKELEDILFNLKCEVKPIDEDYVEVEVNADRVDMFSLEGLTRAAKGLLDKEKGIKEIELRDSPYRIVVGNVPTRKFVAGAVIFDYNINEDSLRELIQFQEKLHSTIGRNRRKVAIGIHDANKIPSTKINYVEVPLTRKMIPLGYKEEMTVKQVLEVTDQGKEYGRISIRGEYHPALVSGNEIISLPPVINSELTRITGNTKNLFIDVTGTNIIDVMNTINILSCNLAENGASIGKVIIDGLPGIDYSPELRNRKVEVKKEYIDKILGMNLSPEVIIELLSKMRLDARNEGNLVLVTIPPYRIDIIGPSDVIEEIAMSIGYSSIQTTRVISYQKGRGLKIRYFENYLRDLVISYGFTEVITFVLTNSKLQSLLGLRFVSLKNPVSVELDSLRSSLIPNIIDFLKNNLHSRMPLKVFELGKVVIRNDEEETRASTTRQLCMSIMDSKVEYHEIQSYVDSLLNDIGFTVKYVPYDDEIFIHGRAAKIIIENKEVGVIGEINPKILENLKISYPIGIGEINVDKIFNFYENNQ